MRGHLAYLRYVLRHKWFVFLACGEVGASFWLALIHDWTKFTRREWSPYVHQFYNSDGTKRGPIRDASGAYDPNLQPVEFQLAWVLHQRNKHHWQAWVSVGDNGKLSPVPIPKRYVLEMVADWKGAGLAISGKDEAFEWYEKNCDKMILHPDTRAIVKMVLTNIYDARKFKEYH